MKIPWCSDIDGEAAGDQSGHSVSLSSDGNIVAIGASGNDGSGKLYFPIQNLENIFPNTSSLSISPVIEAKALMPERK